MRLHLSKSLLASLAVAGALVGGATLTPASAQDADKGGERKPVAITISGTALNPDGTPGAKLPVAIKAPDKQLQGAAGGEGGGGSAGETPPDMLSQGQGSKAKQKGGGITKTLAKGVTDESGKFAIKVTTTGQGEHVVFVEIGEPAKSNWARKSIATKGKDVDMGNIQLSARAG